jgi:hypothetical protein
MDWSVPFILVLKLNLFGEVVTGQFPGGDLNIDPKPGIYLGKLAR